MTSTLIRALTHYTLAFPSEEATSQKIIALLKRSGEDAFCNDYFEDGHITGSMLITNSSKTRVLLIFHKKLQKWLQFGGHSDGNSDVLATAIREFHEESGIEIEPIILQFFPGDVPVADIDIHPIPARGDLPEHFHYDARFIGIIDDTLPLSRNIFETEDMRWFDFDELQDIIMDTSLTRLVGKVRS